jgi:hypothetical protein
MGPIWPLIGNTCRPRIPNGIAGVPGLIKRGTFRPRIPNGIAGVPGLIKRGTFSRLLLPNDEPQIRCASK